MLPAMLPSALPTRVTKEEIEHMSDQQLAFLIRQQAVQVDRLAGGGVVVSQSPRSSRFSQSPELNEYYYDLDPDRSGSRSRSTNPVHQENLPAGDPVLLYNSATPPSRSHQSLPSPHTGPHTARQVERSTERKYQTEMQRTVEETTAFPSSPSLEQGAAAAATIDPTLTRTRQDNPPPAAPAPLQDKPPALPSTLHGKPPPPVPAVMPAAVVTSIHTEELIHLRSQLAQSLGREDYMREKIKRLQRNSSSSSSTTASGHGTERGSNRTADLNGETKQFQEAVVECIEELNGEMNLLSQEHDVAANMGVYYPDTIAFNDALSLVDQLILQARRSSGKWSPSKKLEKQAILSTFAASKKNDAALSPVVYRSGAAASTAERVGASFPLSRGIQPLSGHRSQSQTTLKSSPIESFHFIQNPVLGMDRRGNITVK